MWKNFVITFLFLCLPLNLFSQGTDTTAADFLKIPTNPRSIGLGEAFCAVSGDVNNINVNPAGLGMLTNNEITFMHMEWFETMNYEYLAYVHPTKNFLLGGSIIYFYLSPFSHYGDYGQEVGILNVSDLAFTFSFIKVLFDYSIGINFKLINRNLASTSALGFGFDIGILKRYNFLKINKSPENNLSVGFAIQNLGPKMKFVSEEDPLPLNFKFGIAYNLIEEFLFAIDFNKPIDKEGIPINLGAEYTLMNIFSLRCGYKIGYKLESFSAGSGLKYKMGKITYFADYAFILDRAFDNTHAISIKLAF